MIKLIDYRFSLRKRFLPLQSFNDTIKLAEELGLVDEIRDIKRLRNELVHQI